MKKNELDTITARISNQNEAVSRAQEKVLSHETDLKRAKGALASTVQSMISTLTNLSEAIDESVSSKDADAIEQTILLAHSIGLIDFKSDVRSKRVTIGEMSDAYALAGEEERDALQELHRLEEARDTLLDHIEEIENIQEQIEAETD